MAWDKFAVTMQEKQSEMFNKWQQWCFEHKDTIYQQMMGWMPENQE